MRERKRPAAVSRNQWRRMQDIGTSTDNVGSQDIDVCCITAWHALHKKGGDT